MSNEAARGLLDVVVLDSLVLAVVILVFWAGVFVARRLGFLPGYGLGSLGLSRPKTGYFRAVGLGLLVGFGALVVSFVALPLSNYVVDSLGYSTERSVQGPFMEGLSAWIRDSPGIAIPAAILVVVLFAPFVEETLFRGVVFGGLYKLSSLVFGRLRSGSGKGKAGAVVSFVLAALASSAAFALLHLEPVLLPTLLLLAVALCALYRKTGSVLPCVVAHATFNSFATLILILNALGALPAPA